jgi:hypothetical protein
MCFWSPLQAAFVSVKAPLDRSSLVARWRAPFYDWTVKRFGRYFPCFPALALLLGACGGDDHSPSSNSPGNGTISTTPGCKRGVAWAGQALTVSDASQGLSWWYNWGTRAEPSSIGVAFEPMVWGDGFDASQISEDVLGESQFLLGFNEPNFFAQADLSASEAAQLWPQLQQIASNRGLGLVSPAVNFCGDDQAKTGPCHDTNPVDYLTEFFAACQGCQIDHVAVHWYNCDGDSLRWYLGEFKRFGRPIWLTEFACAYGGDTSVAGQEQYMREAVPILEDDPDVYRYAWFSGSPIPEAELLTDQGALTPLGQAYVQLPHNDGCDR